MKLILFLMVSIFINSCAFKSSDEMSPYQFFNEIQPKIQLIQKISLIEENLKNSQKGIPLKILEATYLDVLENQVYTFCLFYREKYKSLDSELSFGQTKDTSECDYSKIKNTLKEIDKFSFKIEKRHKLFFQFKKNSETYDLAIFLLNVKDSVSYSSALPIQSDALSPLLNLPIEKFKIDHKIGHYEDSFKDNNARKCRAINENCEVVGEDLCSLCRYGWYEVSDYNCPMGGSRFCGKNECGQKGQPACPSGAKVFGLTDVEICQDDSETGFCQDELRPICGKDNVLICR